MTRKAAVFGSGGQLGVELVRELKRRGYTVSGFERKQVDITESSRVENSLGVIAPDLVFNAAAYNQVDISEREPATAFRVNGLAVRNLAVACRQMGARFIHFSTDYVFDGMARRPYTEADPTHPLGAYAVSKLAGELYARAYVEDALIIRTSGVFGPAGRHTNRGNFIELMLRLAAGDKPIRVVEDHTASPTYAPALAERTLELVESDASGVFHIGGGTPITWYEYARMIFRLSGLDPKLTATNEREYRTPARRPKYSALDNGKMEAAGAPPMEELETAVRTYLANRN